MPVPKERRILGRDRLKGVKINVGYPPPWRQEAQSTSEEWISEG